MSDKSVGFNNAFSSLMFVLQTTGSLYGWRLRFKMGHWLLIQEERSHKV